MKNKRKIITIKKHIDKIRLNSSYNEFVIGLMLSEFDAEITEYDTISKRFEEYLKSDLCSILNNILSGVDSSEI